MTNIYRWTQLDPTALVAMKGMGGEAYVVVPGSLMKALEGDGTSAVLLTRLIYWSQSEVAEKNDGWFYLTGQKVTEEFGIKRDKQLAVRKHLENLGIIEWKRVGLPAKNYYRVNLARVLELVAGTYYDGSIKMSAMTTTGGGENQQQDDGDANTIVLNRVINTKRKLGMKNATHSNRTKKSMVKNVLAERYESFLAWVQQNYPMNVQGLTVTEHQARRVAKKLGDIPINADEETEAAAKARVQEFIKGVKNFNQAVESGEWARQYVYGFDRFAGIGIPYGREPYYVTWARKQAAPPKKQELVV